MNLKKIRRKKKKGFTLIELLAVILILGVIALIAVPTIGNVINEAKMGSFKTSVQNIVSAAEQQCQIDQLSGNKRVSIYTFTDKGVTPKLNVKGQLPNNGAAVVDDECNVKVTVANKDYIITKMKEQNEYTVSAKPKSDTLLDVTNNLLSNSLKYNYMNGTYLKGIQDNNHLWFSGNLYHIMGKDQNGNIKMISSGSLTSIPYGPYGDNANVFATSFAKNWLNNYFYSRLEGSNLLQTTPYCADSTTDGLSVREKCNNIISNTKVTLLSLDEFNLSRENLDTDADNSYMYYNRPTISYTLTGAPTSWNTNESLWTIYKDENTKIGDMEYFDASDGYGILPVITLSPNINIITGTGTEENPYIIQNIGVSSGSLINNAKIGEYINYYGRNYRMIENISNVGTKVIMDGYSDISIDIFEARDIFLTSANSQYLDQIFTAKEQEKLVNYEWDKGPGYESGDSYTVALSNSANKFTSKLGGLRLGNMYSTQSITIPSNQLKRYWPITNTNNSNFLSLVFVEECEGYHGILKDYIVYGNIRPVVVLDKSLIIKSGNGTYANPYIVN